MMFSTKVIILLFTITSMNFLAESFPSAAASKPDLAPFLNKKYELAYSDDSFDEVMKALGVSFLQRKLGKLAKPVMKLTEKDGEYTLTSDSIFKNVVSKFKIGEEFDDETPDGRKVKTLFIQDKNKLTQIQRGEKTTIVVREFSAEEVKVTVQVDDIVSVRIYKAM